MRFIQSILFIFATLLFTNVFSQVGSPIVEKNERIRANERKHHVKSIRSYAHTVDSKGKTSRNGQLISEVICNEQGLGVKTKSWINHIIMTSEYEYNDQGKLVKEVKKADGKVVSSLTHEYNTNGKLVKTQYYKADGTPDIVEEIHSQREGNEITVYNAKGEVSSKTETRYDSASRIYTLRVLSRSGKLKYENNFKLDEKGNIVEWWMTDDLQAKRTSIKFTNDENGNELEQQMFGADGSFKEKNVSLYNEKGLKIEHARYAPIDTKIEVMRYEYEYYEK